MLILVVLAFLGSIPIFIILTECCLPDVDLPRSSQQIIWPIAALFFALASATGFLMARAFINGRVDSGKWLAPPDKPDKTSSPPISMTTGRYLGRAILSLLFLISLALGTAVLYSLFGFLTGGAIAFLIRFINDLFLDLKTENVQTGEMTQRRMQKYLEYEYGTVMWRLFEEARKYPERWREQVSTQEGLEAWAEETREKLGYPPHSGEIERLTKEHEKNKFKLLP